MAPDGAANSGAGLSSFNSSQATRRSSAAAAACHAAARISTTTSAPAFAHGLTLVHLDSWTHMPVDRRHAILGPYLGRIQAGCACFHTSPLWPHPSTHWTRHIPAGLCLAIPSGAGALTDISVLTHARRRVRRLKYDGQRGRGRRDGHRRLLRRRFRSRADHRLRMRVMTVKSAVLAGGSVCASTLCPWV